MRGITTTNTGSCRGETVRFQYGQNRSVQLEILVPHASAKTHGNCKDNMWVLFPHSYPSQIPTKGSLGPTLACGCRLGPADVSVTVEFDGGNSPWRWTTWIVRFLFLGGDLHPLIVWGRNRLWVRLCLSYFRIWHGPTIHSSPVPWWSRVHCAMRGDTSVVRELHTAGTCA